MLIRSLLPFSPAERRSDLRPEPVRNLIASTQSFPYAPTPVLPWQTASRHPHFLRSRTEKNLKYLVYPFCPAGSMSVVASIDDDAIFAFFFLVPLPSDITTFHCNVVS